MHRMPLRRTWKQVTSKLFVNFFHFIVVFEAYLQQIAALDARVALLAAPMPCFTAIDTVAQALGFRVKFATSLNDKNMSN